MLKLLIEHKADLNLEDKYGQTCIFYAIKEGHYDIVKTLIEEGVDLNKIDKKKLNPYTYALKFNQTQIAQLLHSKGANDITSGKADNKDKKNKNKKQKSNIENLNVNEEQENIESKPKKFLLVKINPDGTKKALTSEELDEFKKSYEEISNILSNEEKLKDLENEMPSR